MGKSAKNFALVLGIGFMVSLFLNSPFLISKFVNWFNLQYDRNPEKFKFITETTVSLLGILINFLVIVVTLSIVFMTRNYEKKKKIKELSLIIYSEYNEYIKSIEDFFKNYIMYSIININPSDKLSFNDIYKIKSNLPDIIYELLVYDNEVRVRDVISIYKKSLNLIKMDEDKINYFFISKIRINYLSYEHEEILKILDRPIYFDEKSRITEEVKFSEFEIKKLKEFLDEYRFKDMILDYNIKSILEYLEKNIRIIS